MTEELITYLSNRSKIELDRALNYAYKIDDYFEVLMTDTNRISAEMPSESSKKEYKINISFVKKKISSTCTCPAFAKDRICKHIHTAIADHLSFEWSLDVDSDDEINAIQILEWAVEGSLHAEFEGKDISDSGELEITGDYKEGKDGWIEIIETPEQIYFNYQYGFDIPFPSVKDKRALVKVKEDIIARYWHYKFPVGAKKSYDVEIKFDGDKLFEFRCSCGTKPACKHVGAMLGKLESSNFGYFAQCKNFDKEKNELLAMYGLSLQDPEAADFSFPIEYGILKMEIPHWAVQISDSKAVEKLAVALLPPQKKAAFARPKPAKDVILDFEIGFLLNLTGSRLGIMDYELEVVKILPPKTNGQLRISKMDTHQELHWPLLSALPDELYAIAHSLTKPALEKYAIENLGLGSVGYYAKWSHLTDRMITGVEKFYRSQLRQIWPILVKHPHFYMLPAGRFAAANIVPAKAILPFLEVIPQMDMNDRFITLRLTTNLTELQADDLLNEAQENGNDELDVSEEKPVIKDLAPGVWEWQHNFFYISQHNQIALPASDKDEEWFTLLPGGLKRIPIQQKQDVIKTLIPVLEQRAGKTFKVPDALMVKRILAHPEPRIVVSEYMEKYLMLMPQFTYDGHLVDFNRNETEIWLQPEEIATNATEEATEAGAPKQMIIPRETATEMAFYESLRSLHPTFNRQLQNDFYYVPFDQVMQGQWFIKTLHKLSDDNVPVYGIDKLKKFKYSALKPKWEMKTGSQTDWFDVKIEVKFGEEIIPLKTIRKAFASGQQVIMLNDNSLGVLPDEWLKQYGVLLKMGQEKEPGTIRLSKLHYTLIEALHEEIDDEKVLAELEDKKQRLLGIDKVKKAVIPKDIKASLRPYQTSGFLWMNTLEQMGWGGCLADDMGLGKTLQTITFLQHLKKQYPQSTHLVVCPTSLLYNWENELRKFAPKLKFWVHYGVIRQLDEDNFKEHDIILTSYGLVRSDIELLKSFSWHYLILDESQAIKNPDALTTRALHLIPAKNRLILSGTPLQNNTYDLYAQFNFLNPGMLGSREFFREEFANPIDKSRDKHKADTLRRILHPFMLRRTKAQVAPDLPAKTESILWCDMPKEQQQVYDAYKLKYRQALMQKIDEFGMGKAGMLIIEGLLRLRQICNSPKLLKDKDYPTLASAKIEELMREIHENTGGHKMLIFSQFTEMLHLIENELKLAKIGYAYLDGSTPAVKRKEAVEKFQGEENVRVFLISLKAGGVGLNLTAADYVYLVDPWWNPAAEQQAIDRTHRIGQTQKIFAYKMICRNTVEEKILELQNKKRKLAGDLIGEDEAVAKNLTKDDIAFLFS